MLPLMPSAGPSFALTVAGVSVAVLLVAIALVAAVQRRRRPVAAVNAPRTLVAEPKANDTDTAAPISLAPPAPQPLAANNGQLALEAAVVVEAEASAAPAAGVAVAPNAANPLLATSLACDLDVAVPNVYRVARDFVPSNPDELEVAARDIVVVLERYSDGWLLVDNDGVEGVIPFLLCEPLFAQVTADFAASGVDEISLSAGSTVHVFEYFDDGWALVRPIDAEGRELPAGMVPQDLIDDDGRRECGSIGSDSEDSSIDVELIPVASIHAALPARRAPLCEQLAAAAAANPMRAAKALLAANSLLAANPLHGMALEEYDEYDDEDEDNNNDQ